MSRSDRSRSDGARPASGTYALLSRRLSLVLLAAIVVFAGAGNAAAQSLPSGWADQDIGAVGLAGSATYSGGTYTVRGAGADIWDTADGFNFVNLPLTGDGQVIAHVRSMDSTNTYAKAGVMIRETLSAGSAHLVLDMNPSGAVEFMTRPTTGSATSYIAGGRGSWLKLVRSGGQFTASVSGDGLSWTSVGSRSVTLAATAWVGLVVCSHNTGALNTSVFDSVTVTPASTASGGTGGPLPSGWVDEDLGTVGLAGGASYSSGTFTARGAGADIWGTADAFNFAYLPLAADGQIIAHVRSMDNTNTYAKAGVMIRESLTPGSAHVILDMNPSGAVEFMTRATPGGTTSYIAGGRGSWLKLARSNGVFTASVSADGASWTSVGSRAVTLAAPAWVGLVVCSHNTSVLNTSVFDNVSITAASGGATNSAPTVSITSPSSGTSILAGSETFIAGAASDSDATPVAKVDFYLDNGTSKSLLGTATASPYGVSWVAVTPGSYSLTAVATDTAGLATASSPVTVTVFAAVTGGLPTASGWRDQDIGTVNIAGSAGKNAVFTVDGAGSDIWGTADSFNFAYMPLAGDGEIVAHVAWMQNTSAYAKAGVMIRETLGSNSTNVLLDMKPGGGVEFMARPTAGASTSFIAGAAGSWLKLARNGNLFTASISTDGTTWTSIGSTSVTMAANVSIGLVVCSHNASVLNTSVFDHVAITSPSALKIVGPPNGTTFLAGTKIAINVSGAYDCGIVVTGTGSSAQTVAAQAQAVPTNNSNACTLLWSTSNLPAGDYWVKASDTSVTVFSEPILVHLSTTLTSEIPPTISITNVGVSGTNIVIGWAANDPDATPVSRVDFYYSDDFGGHWLGSATGTSPFTGPMPDVGPGFAVGIYAVVTDTAGVATFAEAGFIHP